LDAEKQKTKHTETPHTSTKTSSMKFSITEDDMYEVLVIAFLYTSATVAYNTYFGYTKTLPQFILYYGFKFTLLTFIATAVKSIETPDYPIKVRKKRN
jgi:hypothetical protein